MIDLVAYLKPQKFTVSSHFNVRYPHYVLSRIVVCRYTEIPNRYPIFSNTDTDTDVDILNTENTENSVRCSPSGAVRCVTF